jgi:hypothetical protein
LPLPPFERPTVQLDDLVGLLAPRLELLILLHHGELHAGLLRHDADGFGERDVLHLHHELED